MPAGPPWPMPPALLLILTSVTLTVQLAEDGTRGFSIDLEPLRTQRARWLPEQHASITLADQPVDLGRHLAGLGGRRTVNRLRDEPEIPGACPRDGRASAKERSPRGRGPPACLRWSPVIRGTRRRHPHFREPVIPRVIPFRSLEPKLNGALRNRATIEEPHAQFVLPGRQAGGE